MADTRGVHSPKRVCAPLLSLLRWGRWRGARMCTPKDPAPVREQRAGGSGEVCMVSLCAPLRGGSVKWRWRRTRRALRVMCFHCTRCAQCGAAPHCGHARQGKPLVALLRVAGASCAGRLPGEKPKQAACSARSARARPSSTMGARAQGGGGVAPFEAATLPCGSHTCLFTRVQSGAARGARAVCGAQQCPAPCAPACVSPSG